MSRSAATDGSNPLGDVLIRWEAVAARWSLDGRERTALLGGFDLGPVDRVETYGPVDCERRMRLVVAFAAVLERVHPDTAELQAWLRSGNVNLDGRTPIDMMAANPAWMHWVVESIGAAT